MIQGELINNYIQSTRQEIKCFNRFVCLFVHKNVLSSQIPRAFGAATLLKVDR